ncbi:J domain-containing protein [Thauera sp. AutoDN2]|jgi:DnaJ-class molecular chaperone|uniref:J domain-containing protein n=1 Tax=Thauera sp. AutoDN2 TaxID=3416051 RepID=UPI003F4BC82A
MAHVRSHYDNLKVVRNAPPEVIRAAYRALAQRYHPDRTLNDPEAARIMSIINEAYRILSDPELRKEHDRWLTLAESNVQQPVTDSTQSSKPADVPVSPYNHTANEATFVSDDVIDLDRTYRIFVRNGPLFGITLIVVVLFVLIVLVAALR